MTEAYTSHLQEHGHNDVVRIHSWWWSIYWDRSHWGEPHISQQWSVVSINCGSTHFACTGWKRPVTRAMNQEIVSIDICTELLFVCMAALLIALTASMHLDNSTGSFCQIFHTSSGVDSCPSLTDPKFFSRNQNLSSHLRAEKTSKSFWPFVHSYT